MLRRLPWPFCSGLPSLVRGPLMGGEPHGPELRPLPGVSMPLLPDERRARRLRRWAVGGGLALLALGGSAAALWWRFADVAGERPSEAGGLVPPEAGGAALATRSAHDASASSDGARESGPEAERVAPAVRGDLEDAAVPTEQPPVSLSPSPDLPQVDAGEGASRRVERRFGRSPGFRRALRSLGLDDAESRALERALRGKVDFRRCQPEDRLVLHLGEGGEPTRFRYHGASPLWYVEAERAPGGSWRARRVERVPQRIRTGRAGQVVSSLRQAVEQAALPPSVVGQFVSVFGSRADFATDTRKGDRFRLLLDEERLDGRFLRWGTVHLLEYLGQRTGPLRAYWFVPRRGRGDYYDEEGRSVGGWLRPPLRYDHVSSRFDPRRRHPILKRIVPHTGVDFAASRGTPVWAAADGVVRFAGRKGPNGNLVVLDHGNGYQSFYAHLHRIARSVRPGRRLRRGEMLGSVGSTGRSTGPHLHFALKRGGRFVDPLQVMHGPGPRLPSPHLRRFRRHAAALRRELDRLAPLSP